MIWLILLVLCCNILMSIPGDLCSDWEGVAVMCGVTFCVVVGDTAGPIIILIPAIF